MMMQPRSRPEESLFIVRVWKERDGSTEAQWRASVTHVTSGERRYFTQYDELQRFIERWKK
jgi:hypothetical protein